jgi:hypothetical protein
LVEQNVTVMRAVGEIVDHEDTSDTRPQRRLPTFVDAVAIDYELLGRAGKFVDRGSRIRRVILPPRTDPKGVCRLAVQRNAGLGRRQGCDSETVRAQFTSQPPRFIFFNSFAPMDNC